jgi:hypothetical protein
MLGGFVLVYDNHAQIIVRHGEILWLVRHVILDMPLIPVMETENITPKDLFAKITLLVQLV